MPTNAETKLSFSDDHIDARWVTEAINYPIDPRTIVVNTSTRPVNYVGGVEGMVAPWKSTILERTTIRSADSLVTLRVTQITNIGGVVLGKNWRWYGSEATTFPQGTPLYISTQDGIGQAQIDPRFFCHQKDQPDAPEPFDVRVNLWFTPEQTDCVIHTGHTFLEIHTQVFGTGHMQKFYEDSEETLYEDVFMPPGLTNEPFPVVDPDGQFNYPWHRYFADTDCIWLVIELHPQAG